MMSTRLFIFLIKMAVRKLLPTLPSSAFDSHYGGSRTTVSVHEALLKHVGRIITSSVTAARASQRTEPPLQVARSLSLPLMALAVLGPSAAQRWPAVGDAGSLASVVASALDAAVNETTTNATEDDVLSAAWIRGRIVLSLAATTPQPPQQKEQFASLARALGACEQQRVAAAKPVDAREVWAHAYFGHASSFLSVHEASQLECAAAAPPLQAATWAAAWGVSDQAWSIVMAASSAAAQGDDHAYLAATAADADRGKPAALALLRDDLPECEFRAWAIATLLLAATRAGDDGLAASLGEVLDTALAVRVEEGGELSAGVSGIEAVLALGQMWMAQAHASAATQERGAAPGELRDDSNWRISVPDAVAAIEILRVRA